MPKKGFFRRVDRRLRGIHWRAANTRGWPPPQSRLYTSYRRYKKMYKRHYAGLIWDDGLSRHGWRFKQ